ncbi:MAG: MarR family transcriptional regulator [Thermomicrobiales bacterium]
MNENPPGPIRWLRKLVRLESALREHVDARLKQEHDLPLAYFSARFHLSAAHNGSLRVGELARAPRITVGGMSKLVDRLERAGLVCREPDRGDRRVSRLSLTSDGASAFAAASVTCASAMAALLDAGLSADRQRDMHDLMVRRLAATEQGGGS